MSNLPIIHVAVGVVYHPDGRVLLSQRQSGKQHAGYWEFAGGKVEPGETVQQALARELLEECNIYIDSPTPLITIPYTYPDYQVCLDVWEVRGFTGECRPMEGQTLAWVQPHAIKDYGLLPANRGIVNAIQLPDMYAITPDTPEPFDSIEEGVETLVASGIELIRIRRPDAPTGITKGLPSVVIARGEAPKQSQPDCFDPTGLAMTSKLVTGHHLTSTQLHQHTERPVPLTELLGVSLHTPADIEQAIRIEADFGVISPVKATPSHPDATPIGWEGFQALARLAPFPVYALGGMDKKDVQKAKEMGGQGIASISKLWYSATQYKLAGELTFRSIETERFDF